MEQAFMTAVETRQDPPHARSTVRNGANIRRPIIVIGVLLAVLALGIGYWVVATWRNTVPAGEVAVSVIVSQPGEYVGESVTLRGIAGDVLVPGWVFTLQGQDPASEDLLIVARQRFVGSSEAANSGRFGGLPDPGQPPYPEDPLGPMFPLEVRGTVQRFDVAEAERVTGANLNDELRRLFAADLEDWQGKPVVYADQITFLR